MQDASPFGAGNDARFVLSTEGRRRALERLSEGLGGGEPFVLLLGGVGTGKSSLLAEGATAWESRGPVALLANPALSRGEWLGEICVRLGVEVPEQASKSRLLSQLERFLAAAAERGQVVSLVIDDAHEMADELLEELRRLAGLEVGGRRPLRVVLAGLPALEVRLGTPALQALRQRVAARVELAPLTPKQPPRQHHLPDVVRVMVRD